ncbi:macrophage mannose receptor 1-like protein [Leptotrombidium deliense]|uniref:Macrophage mannose receptor 1-like protein n=1 Tax=Leptotrombidium deliense TaxID=299467 RepID=A0A443SGA2_9ACAR|nr:macrophage mannose receptor 1-like protein [Leptotrombidium deliense]
MNATMVTIDSEEENDFLTAFIRTKKNPAREWFYIGATRVKIGSSQFRWFDGRNLTYTNWDDGRPKFMNEDNSYCVVIGTPKGKWHDTRCPITDFQLCQRIIVPKVEQLTINLVRLTERVDEVEKSSASIQKQHLTFEKEIRDDLNISNSKLRHELMNEIKALKPDCEPVDATKRNEIRFNETIRKIQFDVKQFYQNTSSKIDLISERCNQISKNVETNMNKTLKDIQSKFSNSGSYEYQKLEVKVNNLSKWSIFRIQELFNSTDNILSNITSLDAKVSNFTSNTLPSVWNRFEKSEEKCERNVKQSINDLETKIVSICKNENNAIRDSMKKMENTCDERIENMSKDFQKRLSVIDQKVNLNTVEKFNGRLQVIEGRIDYVKQMIDMKLQNQIETVNVLSSKVDKYNLLFADLSSKLKLINDRLDSNGKNCERNIEDVRTKLMQVINSQYTEIQKFSHSLKAMEGSIEQIVLNILKGVKIKLPVPVPTIFNPLNNWGRKR